MDPILDRRHTPRSWIVCGVAVLLLLAVLSPGCGGGTEPDVETAAAKQVQDADAAAAARAELRRERRELGKQRAQLKRERAQIRRQHARARRLAAVRKEKRELAAAAAAAAAPEPEVQPTANCHPSYDPCLDRNASDYDCEGGSGDGPEYTGFVTVTGSDDYGLDSDGDGTGCES
jgi:hypothetical protein